MLAFLSACQRANETIVARITPGLDAAMRHKSSVGAGGDVSSGIDLFAEAVFVEYLAPFGRIESEESGSLGTGDHTIILDPIDGSSNVLSDFPYYGTSAALIDPEGTAIAACVCNLSTGDIFFKERGVPAIQGKLFSTKHRPFPTIPSSEIGLFERAYAYADVVRRLGEKRLKFRAPGAVALSLVYASWARFFLYVGSQRSYDFAAGLLFCEGLEVEVKEDYVIVAHDKKMLKILKTIVNDTKE